jgi:hypothetical protein
MSDARKRNNEDARKSRLKALGIKFAPDFEHEMIKKHTVDTGMRTWHWTNVPEECLYEAGYINNFNERRLKRIDKLKQVMDRAEGKEGEKEKEKERDNDDHLINPIRDYGLDGLAFDGVNYHSLQAKYYTVNKVCANHIGTFLSATLGMIAKNPATTGYLYSPAELQGDLRDFIAMPAYPIKYVHFPWKHPVYITSHMN